MHPPLLSEPVPEGRAVESAEVLPADCRTFRELMGAGKHEQQSKVKHILDEQMKECHKLFEASEKKRRQERQDMLDQIKENQRLSQAEQAQRDALRDKAKAINEASLESLRRRRKAEEEKRQREQDTMLKWMRDENQRQQDQRKADAEEYARKCKQAQDEMNEAIAEAARKKKARQDEDKAFAMAGEKAADDAEARNRAAVQARLDQIDRNCEIIGAEIAGRDAKLEAELQAKIQKIQEDADRAAKEDAERRKADRDAKVRSMLDSLDMQMKQREEDVRQEKEDSIKQAMIFKREYEEGLANDRAKEERARQAREDMDRELVAIMRRNARLNLREETALYSPSRFWSGAYSTAGAGLQPRHLRADGGRKLHDAFDNSLLKSGQPQRQAGPASIRGALPGGDPPAGRNSAGHVSCYLKVSQVQPAVPQRQTWALFFASHRRSCDEFRSPMRRPLQALEIQI
eukprot:s3_g49.t3